MFILVVMVTHWFIVLLVLPCICSSMFSHVHVSFLLHLDPCF